MEVERGQGPGEEPAPQLHPGLAQHPPKPTASSPCVSSVTEQGTIQARGLIPQPWFCLPIHGGLKGGGAGAPPCSLPALRQWLEQWETCSQGGTRGSLELAEDVCIFCRDAGGLQDSHAECEDAAQLQVVQSCLQWPIWRRFLRAVQEKVLWGHCKEKRVLSPSVSAGSAAPGQPASHA